ncbi:MAG: hypothetical protein ACI9R3_005335 [Verrucomicrobiales bacterium]|jgi:hypothetical protein
MNRKSLVLSSLALFYGTAVTTAGTLAGSAPVAPPEILDVEGGMFDEIGAELTLAYDSVYMFRGVDFGDNLVSSDLNVTLPLGDSLSLNVGTWYATLAEDDYAELDLYAGLEYTVNDSLSIGVGYTWYYLPRDSDGWNEVGATIGYSVAGIDFGLAYYYDFETEGSYFEPSVSYEIAITDNVSLVPSVAAGFGDDYYGVSGGNHVGVSLALPIQLTATASLTPYIAGNIAIDSLDDLGEEDQVFGGVALTVGF